MKIAPKNRRKLVINYDETFSEELIQLVKNAINDLTKKAMTKLNISEKRDGFATELLNLGRERSNRDDQLEAGEMITKLYLDQRPDYDLLITKKDIYADDANFIFGVGISNAGCIFSFNRFLGKKNGLEVAKTVLMHEMGHVFGLPDRQEQIEENLGTHCINKCIMRQGLSFQAFNSITRDRLAGNVLCTLCEADLIRFFWTRVV